MSRFQYIALYHPIFKFTFENPNQYSISPFYNQIVNFRTKHLGFKITQLSFRKVFVWITRSKYKTLFECIRHVDLHRNCLRAIYSYAADIPMEDLCFHIIRKWKFPYKIFIIRNTVFNVRAPENILSLRL